MRFPAFDWIERSSLGDRPKKTHSTASLFRQTDNCSSTPIHNSQKYIFILRFKKIGRLLRSAHTLMNYWTLFPSVPFQRKNILGKISNQSLKVDLLNWRWCIRFRLMKIASHLQLISQFAISVAKNNERDGWREGKKITLVNKWNESHAKRNIPIPHWLSYQLIFITIIYCPPRMSFHLTCFWNWTIVIWICDKQQIRQRFGSLFTVTVK